MDNESEIIEDQSNDHTPSSELKNILRSLVDEILCSVDVETYITEYKKIFIDFEKNEGVKLPLSGSSKEATDYREQFHKIIRKEMFEAINETVEHINGNLKEVEELSELLKESSFTWRPPGNAKKHMEPFNALLKLDEKNKLEEKVKKLEEECEMIQRRLTQKRNKAKDLHKELKESLDKISEKST